MSAGKSRQTLGPKAYSRKAKRPAAQTKRAGNAQKRGISGVFTKAPVSRELVEQPRFFLLLLVTLSLELGFIVLWSRMEVIAESHIEHLHDGTTKSVFWILNLVLLLLTAITLFMFAINHMMDKH